MPSATDLISPKQAARALGVSESSLKRWCDRGLLQAVRTAGGHRKLPTADVLRFVREHQHRVIAPEVLGLPPTSEGAELGLSRGGLRLAEALLAGDEESARRIVFDLYLAKHSIAAIGDGVMARAFREIGDRWACNEADIYQERRGCEIVLRILHELRRAQTVPAGAPRAVGATFAGDHYSLPLSMTEVVLRSVGFEATLLGTGIPIESLLNAIRDLQPRLFFASVSHLADEERFVTEFARLVEACQAQGTALVVGGRMLSETLRPRLTYSAFCDTLQQLESFAAALVRAGKRPRRPATASRPRPRRS
jgi:excisionase family DNA binding protein